MKKRSFRSTFVSVILVITVAISIVNLAVYGINIKKIRQVEVLKMKTAGERIDDMITISLNNIKGLKQICCTDNYARNILLKNNEKNDIGTKFENQNYMDNALKHIASMDTLILRATIVNKYGNIYCTDTSIPEEYVKTIRNMTKEWMLFEGKEDEYYYGGLQGDNANILTFLYPLHTYGNTPIALLAVDINYKTFQSILENAFYENSGECFILTGEQELFHIGEDLYQKEEKGYIFDKSQKMMKENLIVDTFQSKGKNFYISSRQNMLSGWKIIQVIPEERLFEEVDQKIKWNSIFLLVMEYPEDRSARNVELEYFLGDSLLVVPVFDQEDEIDVYLPNGQWIDLFTHERIKGGRWVKRKIELDKIPVFIRQNKMIPMLTKIPENIEEKYENLDVILFCEDEIRDTYIDDGNVQNLKAKIEEGTLFINTDMDASYFTVYAEKCLDNAVVNGQNWEIKKEKEGYYKIALEK